MNRRAFLSTTAAALAAPEASAQAAPFPIIDTHIHLFDPNRPQGIPWPPKTNAVLYQPALPERYRKIAVPLGIVGAIQVECSPWLEDNQWVLDVCDKDKIMVGHIGNIEAGKPGFRQSLERFHRNPLYLGIRCGNLWGRKFHEDSQKPEFIADLKALADAGLTMDSANPNMELLGDLLKVTDKVPSLRLVIDHLAQMTVPADAAGRKAYEGLLREFGKRPQVYLKVSEVLRRVDGRVPEDVAFYKPRLDEFWETFGPDRVIYGSDWPNSDNWAQYPVVLKVVREYALSKGRAVAEKYFWKNSVAAYRWVKREANQPKA